MHEVPAFLAVLVQMDGLSQAQLIGEDREDAGIRVLERLPFAIDVLETEDHRWNPRRLRSNAHQILLGQFGGGIDRRGRGLCALWRGGRVNFAATGRAWGLPARRPQPQLGTRWRIHNSAPAAMINALAIHRPGRGQDDLDYLVLMVG